MASCVLKQFSSTKTFSSLQPFLSSKFGTNAFRTTANSAFRMDEDPTVLGHREDNYNGIIVETATLPTNGTEFRCGLRSSVEAWKAQGKGGVWLKLPIALSSYVPVATSLGFQFHHAEPDYVMLTTWLQERPSPLPASASHQVGVGVLVLNGEGEMLVVKERTGPAAKLDIWKVPTGLLDKAEDFSAAAVREVKEETGLDVVFEALLCMRQAHGFAFSSSDLFMLCAAKLDPSSQHALDQSGRPCIVPCDKEIKAAKWMPIEEYASSEFAKSHSAMREFVQCMCGFKEGTYAGFGAREVTGVRGGRQLIINGLAGPPGVK